MKFKNILALVLIMLMTSCATVHKGKYAKQVKLPSNTLSREKLTQGGLVISGRLEKSLSNDYYKFIGFTFENRTGNKISIKEIKLDFQTSIWIILCQSVQVTSLLAGMMRCSRKRGERSLTAKRFSLHCFLEEVFWLCLVTTIGVMLEQA